MPSTDDRRRRSVGRGATGLLGRALVLLVRFGGPAWVVRNTVARNRVSIVLYHDPAPESFGRQLRWLLRRYSVIPLERLVDALRSGDWSGVPARSVVITFDDGRAGNLRLLELFRRHRVVPSIYLCTGIVGTRRRPWSGCSEPDHADRALSREEVLLMQGACDLQSHTRFHSNLPSCPEGEAWREIVDSRDEVEALTGAGCDHFAYPGGAYTEREVELVERAGYLSARTVDIGWNHRASDPYRLRILSMDSPSITMLAAELSGLKWLSRLVDRKGGLRGKRIHARHPSPPGTVPP